MSYIFLASSALRVLAVAATVSSAEAATPRQAAAEAATSQAQPGALRPSGTGAGPGESVRAAPTTEDAAAGDAASPEAPRGPADADQSGDTEAVFDDTEASAEPESSAPASAAGRSEYPFTALTPPVPPVSGCVPPITPGEGMGELGVALGMIVISRRHNFHTESVPHQRIEPAPELVLRGAWFPLADFGVEGEGALGSGHAEDGSAAYPWALRMHAIGQLVLPRLTPFALLGFGRMGNVSNALGSDGDPLLHLGAGAKVYLSERAAVRFDFRDNLTQRNGSPEGSLTNNLEVLVGASIVLGVSQ